MGVGIRKAIPMLFLIVVLGVLALLVGIVYFARGHDPTLDGRLTHEEFMRLSSGEAHGLRLCQREEIFAQMERRYGSRPPKLARSKAKAWEEYKKLMKAQQREGQPTMPKFVDPGDLASFQETMWKKGYKCVGGDWQEYYSD